MEAELLASLKKLVPDEPLELLELDKFILKHASVYELKNEEY